MDTTEDSRAKTQDVKCPFCNGRRIGTVATHNHDQHSQIMRIIGEHDRIYHPEVVACRQ